MLLRCLRFHLYFYPRPPRGGRRFEKWAASAGEQISIHALREEGDFNVCSDWQCVDLISIHALREEGDREYIMAHSTIDKFLSTPSMRRATDERALAEQIVACISIHALHEEGDCRGQRLPARGHISIHALHEEGDAPEHLRRNRRGISIHALHEEGDISPLSFSPGTFYFYPRPP